MARRAGSVAAESDDMAAEVVSDRYRREIVNEKSLRSVGGVIDKRR